MCMCLLNSIVHIPLENKCVTLYDNLSYPGIDNSFKEIVT